MAVLAQRGVTEGLEQRPALLREVVAELGGVDREVLNQGFEVLGLESVGENDIESLVKALQSWDQSLGSLGERPGQLAERVGLQSGDAEAWRSFLGKESGRDLSRRLMSWQAELEHDRGLDKAVVGVFRSGVEAALSPGSRVASKSG